MLASGTVIHFELTVEDVTKLGSVIKLDEDSFSRVVERLRFQCDFFAIISIGLHGRVKYGIFIDYYYT